MSHPGQPFDPSREEIVHLAGDVPDPVGISPGLGYQSTVKLDKSKTEVSVRYKDFLLTCDLYRVEGAPVRLIVQCPKCRNMLTITGDRKDMQYESRELAQFGGRLSVETFQCTWEQDSSRDGRRMEFGLGLCGWRVAIDNNIAKDA